MVLSAHVGRVSVSSMHDFFLIISGSRTESFSLIHGEVVKTTGTILFCSSLDVQFHHSACLFPDVIHTGCHRLELTVQCVKQCSAMCNVQCAIYEHNINGQTINNGLCFCYNKFMDYNLV